MNYEIWKGVMVKNYLPCIISNKYHFQLEHEEQFAAAARTPYTI